MKTILIVLLCLVAWVYGVSAGSPQLPKKFIGAWCGSSDFESRYYRADKNERCKHDNPIFLTKDGYSDSVDIDCKFTSIKTRPSNGVIITYIDDARCHDYGSDEYYDKS